MVGYYQFKQSRPPSANALNTNEDAQTKEEKKTKFATLREKAKAGLEKFGDEKITGAIEGVGKGLTQLVGGVKSGDWKEMLLGGLSIIGSLASLAGPIGAAISSILSIVSMVFGLFSGSNEAVESQEGMLKRVINEALTRSRADDLRAEGAGLRKAINSIRNSINLFREEKEKKIDENQAVELYNQAFRGLTFFGKLNYAIDKYCDCTVENENTTSKAREDSARCLEFINLYGDLSIIRQLLMADLASLVGSVDLNATAVNLLHLTEKEQSADKEIFQFLLDPISYKPQRFCVAQFYGQPDKYPVLQAYLKTISKSNNKIIEANNIVICSQRELLGHCYKLKKTKYTKSDLQEWSSGGIKSIFISLVDGMGITGYSGENFNGSLYGPFRGQTVFGAIPGISWNSIKIEPLMYEYDKSVRVCEKEKLSQEGRCDVLEITTYPNLFMTNSLDDGVFTKDVNKCIFPFSWKGKRYRTCTKDGGYQEYWCATSVNEENEMKEWGYCVLPRDWSDKIKSMSIPENVEVKLYTEENFEGDTYGPFYGSNIIDEVCVKKIKSAQIVLTEKKASDMVRICRGESFVNCDLMEIGKYDILKVHNCTYEDKTNKIKSMRVPAGLTVYMWTKVNFTGRAIGPYVGPLSVALIDGGEPETSSDTNFKISSIKIIPTSQADEDVEVSTVETPIDIPEDVNRVKNVHKKHKSKRKKLHKSLGIKFKKNK